MQAFCDPHKQLMLTLHDLLAQPYAEPDVLLSYGDQQEQYGQLFLPTTPGPYPVAVLLHGGCWRARVDLSYLTPASRYLADKGVAVWNLEYRRLDIGGGWPDTFLDVATGTDFLKEPATDYDLELTNLITVGHSAGGHLAHWLAARLRLSEASRLYRADPLLPKAFISIAGIPDLAQAIQQDICHEMPVRLMGGTPHALPSRYQQGSPAELAPLGIKQVFIQGEQDDTVPLAYVEAYVAAAKARGEGVVLERLAHTGHYDPVITTTGQWQQVANWVSKLLLD